MNMIEKVARGLYSQYEIDCKCNRCKRARSDAKAAIEAMREPSEGMINSLTAEWDNDVLPGYKHMIDAALKEE